MSLIHILLIHCHRVEPACNARNPVPYILVSAQGSRGSFSRLPLNALHTTLYDVRRAQCTHPCECRIKAHDGRVTFLSYCGRCGTTVRMMHTPLVEYCTRTYRLFVARRTGRFCLAFRQMWLYSDTDAGTVPRSFLRVVRHLSESCFSGVRARAAHRCVVSGS